jgi:choline dehydrogenase-like flavoprotein
MDEFNGGEISPGPGVATDEQILDWVRSDSETALHPSCTCRMGTDNMSVVDPLTMRVHGLDGLRIVDGSVNAVYNEWQSVCSNYDDRRKVSRYNFRKSAA